MINIKTKMVLLALGNLVDDHCPSASLAEIKMEMFYFKGIAFRNVPKNIWNDMNSIAKPLHVLIQHGLVSRSGARFGITLKGRNLWHVFHQQMVDSGIEWDVPIMNKSIYFGVYHFRESKLSSVEIYKS